MYTTPVISEVVELPVEIVSHYLYINRMLSAVATAYCLMLFYITLVLSELVATSAGEKKELTDQLEKEKQSHARGNLLYLLHIVIAT